MKKLLMASIMMASAIIPAYSGPLLKDFDDASDTIERLKMRQLAKCQMDTERYFDEHPRNVSGMSDGQIYQLYYDRNDLCMQAAGWPTIRPSRENVLNAIADTHRRARELWVKAGKSKSDLEWFDKEARYLKCAVGHSGDDKVEKDCRHMAYGDDDQFLFK